MAKAKFADNDALMRKLGIGLLEDAWVLSLSL